MKWQTTLPPKAASPPNTSMGELPCTLTYNISLHSHTSTTGGHTLKILYPPTHISNNSLPNPQISQPGRKAFTKLFGKAHHTSWFPTVGSTSSNLISPLPPEESFSDTRMAVSITRRLPSDSNTLLMTFAPCAALLTQAHTC